MSRTSRAGAGRSDRPLQGTSREAPSPITAAVSGQGPPHAVQQNAPGLWQRRHQLQGQPLAGPAHRQGTAVQEQGQLLNPGEPRPQLPPQRMLGGQVGGGMPAGGAVPAGAILAVPQDGRTQALGTVDAQLVLAPGGRV